MDLLHKAHVIAPDEAGVTVAVHEDGVWLGFFAEDAQGRTHSAAINITELAQTGSTITLGAISKAALNVWLDEQNRKRLTALA